MQSIQPDSIKLIIADDHLIIIDGLEEIIKKDARFHVIAKVSSGHLLLQTLNNLRPDIILIDIYMPGNGMQTAEIIKKRQPAIKIILISQEYNNTIKQFIQQQGINGFFIKHAGAEHLLSLLTTVAAGENMFVTSKPSDSVSPLITEKNKYKLTKIELDIINMAAEGYSTKEIAQKRGRSEVTIEKQRSTIMRKLHARNMAEVIAFVTKNNLTA